MFYSKIPFSGYCPYEEHVQIFFPLSSAALSLSVPVSPLLCGFRFHVFRSAPLYSAQHLRRLPQDSILSGRSFNFQCPLQTSLSHKKSSFPVFPQLRKCAVLFHKFPHHGNQIFRLSAEIYGKITLFSFSFGVMI